MCGRLAFFSPREAVIAAFGADPGAEFAPRYNIAPTQNVQVLRLAEDSARRIDALRWGLVPFWAKDAAIGNRMINARAETLAVKPAYRLPFRRQRCAVLADGFYEWTPGPDHKQPWFIRARAATPLALAGIWDSWSGAGPTILHSCSIVTTTANDFMARLHQRMPVMLDATALSQWLAADTPVPSLQGLLAQPGTIELEAWPVARTVNSPRHDTAELIRPLP